MTDTLERALHLMRRSGGPAFEVYPNELVAGETAGWLEYRIPVERAGA